MSMDVACTVILPNDFTGAMHLYIARGYTEIRKGMPRLSTWRGSFSIPPDAENCHGMLGGYAAVPTVGNAAFITGSNACVSMFKVLAFRHTVFAARQEKAAR